MKTPREVVGVGAICCTIHNTQSSHMIRVLIVVVFPARCPVVAAGLSCAGLLATVNILCNVAIVLLMSWYPFSPLFVEEALFLRGKGIIARLLRAHLSGAF